MHKTDADSHVANMFDEGDPGVPRAPTQIDKHWLNAVQEELISLLTDASIVPVKGTWTQVRDSLRALFVRTTGAATQTVTGVKSFTSKMILAALAGGAGGGGLRLLVEVALGEGTASDFAAAIRNYDTGGGLDVSGATQGVRGTTTGNGATDAGVHGDGATGGGGYGVIARGLQSSPVRSSARIVPQSPAPSSAQMGDLYVNALDGKLYIYNGSGWVVVGAQT